MYTNFHANECQYLLTEIATIRKEVGVKLYLKKFSSYSSIMKWPLGHFVNCQIVGKTNQYIFHSILKCLNLNIYFQNCYLWLRIGGSQNILCPSIHHGTEDIIVCYHTISSEQNFFCSVWLQAIDM